MTGRNLGIVVPVYNEAQNIDRLVGDLTGILAGQDWEVIFVDDYSPDGTAEVVRRHSFANDRVRLVLRVADRGLGRAVVQGLLSAKADVLVVMDGDGQHAASVIPQLLVELEQGARDVVSAARSVSLEEAGQVLGPLRMTLSQIGNAVCRAVLRRQVQDPLTGFFAIRRDAFLRVAARLGDPGFKILLDILSADRSLRHAEVPFDFAARREGSSKLDLFVVWQFATFLMSRLTGDVLPPAFIAFLLVGLSGLMLHLAVLYSLIGFGVAFAAAHLGAILIATSSNYVLNNRLTFAERRLTGWRFLTGYLGYLAFASVGIVASVSVATAAYGNLTQTVSLASMAGVAIDAVWKYTLTSRIVWR